VSFLIFRGSSISPRKKGGEASLLFSGRRERKAGVGRRVGSVWVNRRRGERMNASAGGERGGGRGHFSPLRGGAWKGLLTRSERSFRLASEERKKGV